MKHKTLQKKVGLIFFLLFNLHSIEAQNFHLVKDINTTTNSNPHNYYDQNNDWSNPTSKTDFAVLNDVGYFSADDGENGYGLWRSDGTPQGTYEIKDSINPLNITVSNGKIFFIGQGTGATDLWSSDGTPVGTIRIFDPAIHNLFRDPSLGNLTDVDGTLYFTVSNNDGDGNLWKSDGTIKGTILINTFQESPVPFPEVSFSSFTAAYHKLFFCENSFIWVSDGTSSGTYSISMGSGNIIPRSSDISDSLLYFLSIDTSTSLWVFNVMDGKATKVKGLKDLDIADDNIVNQSGTLYFIAYSDSSHQTRNLYKYDTYADTGVALVKAAPPVNSGNYYSYIWNITNINGSLFYDLYDVQNNKYQLWKTDGTVLGNILLKDNFSFDSMVNVNGTCFAQAVDSAHGNELWKSDGTVGGTVLIKDIFPGKISSSPHSLTALNGSLLFAAKDISHGVELWKSDGTTSGTFLLKDINQKATADADPHHFTPFSSMLLFSATDDTTTNLWKSDGTEAGTFVISDSIYIYESGFNSFPNGTNEYYFFGSAKSGISGLFKTDGTANGTALVKDFTAPNYNFYDARTFSGSKISYFIIDDSSYKSELWCTDGTEANTFVLKKGIGYQTAFLGNTFFFEVNNDLWKTDGTVAGTSIVKAFNPYTNDWVVYNGNLYFTVYDLYFNASNSSLYGLWKTDGTPSGTMLVSNDVASVSDLTPSNGILYFSANGELFETDGTFEGTRSVKSFDSQNGSYLNNFISVNDALYFFVNNDLWKTQGTDSSTKFINSIRGNEFTSPVKVVNVNGELFIFSDTLFYQSDGTEAGTKPVQDNNLAGVSINPFQQFAFASVGDKLFFTGRNYKYGSELYAGTVNRALPVNLISFTGSLENNNSLLKWATASEQESKYFILERSSNAIDFLPVASIIASGNTNNRTDYSYTDPDVVSLGAEKLYYKLKMVDKDGKFTYSNVIVITINYLQTKFTVVPNPVKNIITIFSSKMANNVKVSLLDISGKLLYKSMKDFSRGEEMQIDVTNFSKGAYIVSLQNKDLLVKIKVLKD